MPLVSHRADRLASTDVAPGPRPRRRLIGPVAGARDGNSRLVTSLAWNGGVAVLGMAWLVPETWLSAVGGWVAALLMTYALRSGRSYLSAYFAGLVGHVIGFHWVYRTVIVFGGFGPPAAAAGARRRFPRATTGGFRPFGGGDVRL